GGHSRDGFDGAGARSEKIEDPVYGRFRDDDKPVLAHRDRCRRGWPPRSTNWLDIAHLWSPGRLTWSSADYDGRWATGNQREKPSPRPRPSSARSSRTSGMRSSVPPS